MSNERRPPFQEIEHTADLALRVHGADLAALFVHAAQGMAHLMSPEGPVKVVAEYVVDLQAPDAETLLIDWLNELLYLSEVHGLILAKFEILKMDERELRARVAGGAPAGHAEEIKAATFHNLEIAHDSEGYSATIVFDV